MKYLAELVKTELNREIAIQGGAYDSGCVISSNGALSFYSFKDPHTIQTYQSFELATTKILNGVFRFSKNLF